MKKWLLPGTVALAVILAVAGGTFALAGAFDSDDTPTSADDIGAGECSAVHNIEACDDAEQEGDAARCAEGAEDCDDTGGGDTLGVCAPDWDPEVDGPCNDTVVVGDGGLNMCIEGAEDCNDMVAEPAGCGGDLPAVCDAGEDAAIEAAFAKLAEMGQDTSEVYVSGVSPVEWSDACLGVEQPDVVCAQVITPGFIIVLSGDGDWEFHTDLNGNAVFAPHD